ncbi:hypothetical protein D3C78_1646150 [compost metagenome]
MKVVGDPCVKFGQARIRAISLCSQQGAVLGLLAGTLHVDDKFARDIVRQGTSEITLDDRERHVYASGFTGTAPN